ncbi:hypothetical protein [Flavobacterium poyangense]|uniref:hypothetical protein n=1 Tax=Flavobacterium poyangense TaxID=2204302 RepID=UPI0014216CED|nr:hypothetical protein [Flavobacterium sp. JXAS1]
MKLKQYKIQDNDIVIIGRGKTIKPQQLNKILFCFDTQKITKDFETNKIENYLLNNWEVVYYFVVFNSVLTFSIDEYVTVFNLLKSIVRDDKIKKVLQTQ